MSDVLINTIPRQLSQFLMEGYLKTRSIFKGFLDSLIIWYSNPFTMPEENSFTKRHSCRQNSDCNTACWYRFDFGVPLEDIYSSEELHPRLKVSLSILTCKAFKPHFFFNSIYLLKHMKVTNYKMKSSATY